MQENELNRLLFYPWEHTCSTEFESPSTLLALDSFYKQFLASTEPEQYKSTSVFITSNTPYVKDLKQLTVHARTGTRRDCRLRKN
jgi:hypothetical protein